MSDKKGLTIKQVYDLVWSKPLITVARELNIDAYTLRKICKQHNVPMPKSGYWQKLKHNKEVSKEVLSSEIEKDPTLIIKLNENGHLIYKQQTKEADKIKTEIESIGKLTVPEKLSNPHKYIKATRENHKAIKIRNRTRNWDIKIDETNVLSVSVSDELFPRALRFMDTLIKVMEIRGYGITASRKTTIVLKTQSYNIRLIEKHKRVKRETNNSWPEFDLVPTGNLCLKIDRSYPIKEWGDTKTTVLEDKIADILAWIELKAEEDRKQQIANRIWWAEQEKIRKRKKPYKNKKSENF
ncbi:hypothetical protein [Formosa haliotis]|uniref:hypothetical protein n=1 Tax=Formosa haliotis TaxID=1555194 RepID=UPI000824CE6C|nr:hypothetical protein [Formosa haliotis]